ncbi:LamG-like jellyroll fold domain-containing protein [Kineococcus sp. DHX-1]|uniref:LamG-like jellyroll fold domain-containing protein n=1 Tax=Kineococcus sp. DHX-1 TaxID=3349638 RepID=UPI0036D31D83
MDGTLARRPARLVGAALTAALVVLATVLVGQGPARAADPVLPATVTADVLPTVQVDGVVWAQTTIGNTVYAVGRFANARPAGAAAGTSETPKSNILAYDLTTGRLITTFTAALNADGLGITSSPDGSRVYVVGNFTQANGQNRYRIAAFDATTGALVSGFAPQVDYRARAVVATGSTVYVGGQFSVANKTARSRLAAFSATDGSLLPWAPTADNEVFGLVAPAGGPVVAAGRFTTLDDEAHYGLGAVDPTTGATVPWAAGDVVRNAGPNAAIYSLATDGTRVYGTGYTYGSGGNLEGSFAADAKTGALQWVTGCKGDVYSVQPLGGVVYTAGHAHDCAAMGGWPQTEPWTYQRAVATTADARRTNTSGAFSGKPAPQLLPWAPTLDIGSFTGQNQAAWSVTGNSQYVSLGGEFPKVEGVAQQGLVRLGIRSVAPGKSGPKYSADLVPQTTTTAPGTVRLTWRTTWDADSGNLSYRVVRDGATAAPVATLTAASSWWNTPNLTFVDRGLAPGSSHTYRVYAVDADGNSTNSELANVTLPAASAYSDYARTVLADGASSYWPLGPATSGNRAYDWAGTNDLTLDGSVTASTGRAVAGDPGSASTFPGTGTAPAVSGALSAPSTFSLEASFRTTSTRGGKVIGFGNARTGLSTRYDRHVYVRPDGRLTFGVYSGAVRTVTSPSSYADGQWHQVVATLGPAGMQLYVDGALVAGDASTTTAETNDGYWRVGGDAVSGWPQAPTSTSLAGDLDEVAVYPTALTAAQVAAHRDRALGTPGGNAAPAASFSATTTGLSVAVDGSVSTDADGSVVGWAWDFGDGTTGTGVTASRTYAAAGTYPVRLTVTDDDGATATTTRSVTVSAPADPTVLAADAFGRTVSGGWGSADTGGVWSLVGGASTFSVAGGTGRATVGKGAWTAPTLGSVRAATADVTHTAVLDAAPTGGGVYVSTLARRVDASNDYHATARVLATGEVSLSLVRRSGGVDTTLQTVTVPGLTVAPGTRWSVRVQAVGSGPTTLRARAWATGTAEPTSWQVSTTDAVAGLQVPGAVGLSFYLSGSATTAPVTVSVDDLSLRTVP